MDFLVDSEKVVEIKLSNLFFKKKKVKHIKII